MRPIQQPITGRENSDGSSPRHALSQFYRAFNTRDMHLMAQNWACSDDIAMSNPVGGIKRGWAAIRSIYERIFSGPAEVVVEFFDYTLQETEQMFCAVGRERGRLRSGGMEIALTIRTTRLFRKIDGGWKQIHHHGSIDDPHLLAKYQAAVLG